MSQATPVPCDSCGIEVVFLEHIRTLRLAPIELAEDPDGNIGINLVDGTYMILNKATREAAVAAGKRLHVNHFARCPKAAWHRSQATARS